MTGRRTIQDVVIGHVLSEVSRSSRRARSGRERPGRATRLAQNQVVRGLFKNAVRTPQAVVKRIRAGGTHTKAELKRQLEYITRDEALKASWSNFSGIERDLKDNTIARTVPLWASGWAGNPKRGHTDHIILSFPKGTDAKTAEEISREWGRAVFGSGDYGDRWRYIAALHHNTEHVHTHFVVEKHGLDNERFLSISQRSELTLDAMRELQAKIAGEHGLALNATSRRSRGIVENPPRETDVRAARAEGRSDVPAPPLTITEKMRREAEVRGYADQYRSLSALASMVQASAGPGEQGFMARLASLFQSASSTLIQGESLMATTDLEPQSLDPTERLVAAHNNLLNAARQAWTDIQTMEPGAEKTRMEAEFAAGTREVRGSALSDPFLDAHSSAVGATEDPYRLPMVAELHSARASAERDGLSTEGIDTALQAIRERLVQEYSGNEHRLVAAGTSADEVAERFMLAERTQGQIAQWEESIQVAPLQINLRTVNEGEITTFNDPFEAGKVFSTLDPAERPTATLVMDNGFSVRSIARTVESLDGPSLHVTPPEVFDTREHDRAAHSAFQAGFEGRVFVADPSLDPIAIGRADFLRGVGDAAARIIDDYELPRDVQEMVARDQLLQAERYHRLADVPAIEAIVDRLNETLSQQDLERVRAGDATALLEEVKDPAIRAAVASELRNEAELGEGHPSEGVEQYQQMARLGLGRSKVAEQTHEQEHEL